MPLSNPFSPSKLRRKQRRRSEHAETALSNKEKKKLDKAVWQKFWENPRSTDANLEGRPLTPALPYSKDFGTFDLTLCEGPDGRCIVLVEYDERMFLNGKQIYISDDGTVTDNRGLPDRMLSQNFQCVTEVKYEVRQKDSGYKYTEKNKNIPTMPKSRSEPWMSSKERPDDRSENSIQLQEKPSVRFCLDPKVKQGNRDQQPITKQSQSPRNLAIELQRLESCFSENIGYLCSLVVELSDRNHADTESAKSEDYVLDQQAEYLVNMLTRLSDQFHSMVGLSSTLRDDDATEDASPPCSGAHHGADDEKLVTGDNATESSSEEGVVISVWSREDADEVLKNENDRQQTDDVPSENKISIVESLRLENRQLREEVEAMDEDMSRAQTLIEDIEDRLRVTTKERNELREKIENKSVPTDDGQIDDIKISQLPDSKQLLVNDFEERCSHNTAFYDGSESESEKEEAAAEDSVVSTKPMYGGLGGMSLKTEIRRLRKVYDDVGNSLEILNEENILLRASIVSLRKGKESVHNKLDYEKKQNVNFRTDVEKLDGLNAELEERLATLKKDSLVKEVELQSLREGQTERAATGRRLERKLTDSMTRCQLLESQQADYQKEIEQVAKKQLEETARAARMAKSSAELEVEITELRNSTEKLMVGNHLLRAENEANCTARGRAESLTRHYEEELKLIGAERADALENAKRLSNRNTIFQETISTLEETNAGVSQKNVKLNAANSVLGEQNGDLKFKLKSAKEEIIDLKENSHDLELKNHQMKDTVEDLTGTNSEIRARLDLRDQESSHMSGKMLDLLRTKSELHGMLRKLNGLNSDIETRFEQMDFEYADLEKKLKESEDIL